MYLAQRFVQEHIGVFIGAGFWFERPNDESDFQYRFFDGHVEPCSLNPHTVMGNSYLTEIKSGEDLVWKIEKHNYSYGWDKILANIDSNDWIVYYPQGHFNKTKFHFPTDLEKGLQLFPLAEYRWTLFKNSQNSLDKPISSEYNARCGICGSEAYMGFNTLECSNHRCLNNPKNFKDRVYG